MGRDRLIVTFAVGQAVSYPPAPDGLAQVDGLLRRRVDVIYCRDGATCRRRVRAADLAVWQDTHPLLFTVFNPFARAVPRTPAAKSYRVAPGDARPPKGAFLPGRSWPRRRAS